MEAIIVAREEDIKKWIKEALESYFDIIKTDNAKQLFAEPLLSRREIIKYLDDISLVTLHAWMKDGLPFHKQGGRVYFLKSEVIEHIKRKKENNSV